MWARIKENLIELFFPAKCILCGKIGSFLCPNCEKNLVTISGQTCPKCNRITKKGNYCSRCRPKVTLSGVLVWSYFKDPNIKDLIHAFKYQKLSAMTPLLAEQLVRVIKTEKHNFDLVAFVPISAKRKAWRGFNQAELLATEVATAFNKPLFEGLIKIKDTKTQVGLPKKAREKNLSGAFLIKNKSKIIGKRVLLIDDVITTGTTLNEVAKVLKSAGAREVRGLVLGKE